MWRNGRRNGLKIRWAIQGPCRFESGHRQFLENDFRMEIIKTAAWIASRRHCSRFRRIWSSRALTSRAICERLKEHTIETSSPNPIGASNQPKWAALYRVALLDGFVISARSWSAVNSEIERQETETSPISNPL